MNKLISLFLAALLCLGCLVPAFAESTQPQTAGAFEYRVLENGTVEVLRYTGGDNTACVIPAQIEGRDVTALAWEFQDSSHFKTLFIPKTVSKIPDGVLWKMYLLKSVTTDEKNPNYSSLDGVLLNKDQTRLLAFPAAKRGLRYTVPKTVRVIAVKAFSYAKIPKIKLQSSVKIIENHAFEHVQAQQIILGSGLQEIGTGAFYLNPTRGNLNKIFIPKSVTRIGKLAFGRKALNASESYTVYGYAGSEIEKYCKKSNIDFVAVDLPAPKKTTVFPDELCVKIRYCREVYATGMQVKYTQAGQKHVETWLLGQSPKYVTKTIDGLEAENVKFKIRIFREYAGVNVCSPWVTQTVLVKPKAL